MISVSFVSTETRMAVARTVPGDQVHQTTEETEYCSEMLGENSNVEHSLTMSIQYDNYIYIYIILYICIHTCKQEHVTRQNSWIGLPGDPRFDLRLLPHRLGLVTLRQSPHIAIVATCFIMFHLSISRTGVDIHARNLWDDHVWYVPSGLAQYFFQLLPILIICHCLLLKALARDSANWLACHHVMQRPVRGETSSLHHSHRHRQRRSSHRRLLLLLLLLLLLFLITSISIRIRIGISISTTTTTITITISISISITIIIIIIILIIIITIIKP